MADTASVSSDHYTSSSSPPYVPSPQYSPSVDRRVSSVSQHRPPHLDLPTSKNDQTSLKRPQSQPVMMPGGLAAAATARPPLPPAPGSLSRIQHDEEYSISKNKRRAKSIDIDEVNQSDIARLSLYTPTTARGNGPRELICLCAKAPKVPRPRNGMYFSLYHLNWH
ncbi:hypothetical protein F4679DRAFT_5082 [Xylaria curta]|nr:hypothetical protein F4679DRAFT_5082 [Xylaria curta]